MERLRPILAVSLALVIALTSGAMAIARGQTGAAGSIVLCSGGTSVTVQVDADGQPIGPVHICPDCALSVFDTGHAAPVTIVVPMHTTVAAKSLSAETATPFLLPNAARARAPPIF